MLAKLKIIISIGFAVLFSYSFSEIFIPIHNKNMLYALFVYMYLFILSYFLMRLLLKRSVKLLLHNSMKMRMVKLTCAFLISVLFFAIILPDNYFKALSYRNVTLQPLSMSDEPNRSEVWLKQIIIDRSDLDLQSINLSDGWMYKDGAVVSAGGNNNFQEFNLAFRKDVEFVFGKHEWSGNVEVDDGSAQIVNLYSKTPSEAVITFTPRNETSTEFIEAVAYFVFGAFMTMLIIILFPLLEGIKNIIFKRNK